MSWVTRVTISVSLPLACGALFAYTGVQRWAYTKAGAFWELAGLHDSTPLPTSPIPAGLQSPPLTSRLRKITEGVLYCVMIVPAFVLAIFLYDRLTFRYFRDGQLHCLQCGHILQGLVAPRCPECGRAI